MRFRVLWRLYRVACAVSPDAGMRNGFVRFAKRFVSSPSVVSAARRFFAFCSLSFLFPYLSVPLRFRTRSLHTHSKHLYAYIPLPDGCRNYKLRHSACTLCFKACGFVINTFFTDRSTGVIPCCPSENQTPASFKKAGVFRAYTLLLSFCSLPIFLQILFCYAFLCCCFCTSVLQQFYLYQYYFILSRAVLTILLSAHRLSNRQSRKIASKTGIQESAPLKIPFHAGTKK